MDALKDMMAKEEEFILRSACKRRILIDLYETNLTEQMLVQFVRHIGHISPRIIKLAIAGENRNNNKIRKALL